MKIYVTGHARSGTHWLLRLLWDIVGQYDMQSDEMVVGEHDIIHTHHLARQGNFKVAYIYRDPRDVIVSVMHFWRRNSLAETLHPANDTSPIGTWKAKQELWFDRLKADCYVRYEYMHRDLPLQIQRLRDDLGLVQVTDSRLLLKRHEFKTMRQAHWMAGRDQAVRAMRKGIAGDWRNHFDRRNAKEVHDRLWSWMSRLGFEADEDWWQKCPEVIHETD